jgi:uncharacterized protein YneF (UPF0154 family)
MLRIRKPRNFSILNIGVCLAIGVLGGLYIYKPLLIKYKNEELKQRDSKEK